MVGLFSVGKKGLRASALLACMVPALACIDLALACHAKKKGDIVSRQECKAAMKTRATSLLACHALPLSCNGTLQGYLGTLQVSNRSLLARGAAR